MKYLLILSILFNALAFGKPINKKECINLKGSFIYSAGECIEYALFKGEVKNKLIVLIHGAWREGANTLSRYKPFAENINLDTDITTIAIALPGYSGSSTNHIQALTHNKNAIHMAATKEYINFLSTLLSDIKKRFNAKELTVIAHSAGAMASATILGYRPNLIQNALLAGGRYNIHTLDKEKSLISAVDYMDRILKNTKIVLVYGTKDTISKPRVTKEFFNLVKKRGLNVHLIEIKGAPHINLDMQEKSVHSIEDLILSTRPSKVLNF